MTFATSTFIGIRRMTPGTRRRPRGRLGCHHRDPFDELRGSEICAFAHLHLGHAVDVGPVTGRFPARAELVHEHAQ